MSTSSAPRSSFTRRAVGLGAVAVTVVGAAAVLLVMLATTISSLNPFATTTTEHPDSVVLAKVHDLARFEAASGRFTTLVDQETDSKSLPSWVSGHRVVLDAEGDVTATVDFTGLTSSAIKLSDDGHSATVHLPEPVLDPPRIDPDATRVIARDRGVLDRVGDALSGSDAGDQQELYQRATEKLTDAASQSDLRDRARRNTEQFVRDSLKASGVDDVTVVFDAPTPGQGA